MDRTRAQLQWFELKLWRGAFCGSPLKIFEIIRSVTQSDRNLRCMFPASSFWQTVATRAWNFKWVWLPTLDFDDLEPKLIAPLRFLPNSLRAPPKSLVTVFLFGAHYESILEAASSVTFWLLAWSWLGPPA